MSLCINCVTTVIVLVCVVSQLHLLAGSVTTERTYDCSLDDDGTNPDLTRCLATGREFVQQFLKSMRKHKPSRQVFDTCSEAAEFRGCFTGLIEKCPSIHKRWRHHWEPILQHLQCYCNGSAECVEQHQCFNKEYSGVMVKRCDAFYKFNVRQRTHKKCRFLRESFDCKDALVTSACGERVGHLAFHFWKLAAHELIQKTRCYVVRQQETYNGFRYTETCGTNFVDQLNECTTKHFADSMLYFNEDNDLVVDGRKKTVRKACKTYKDYEKCLQPIREVCPDGTRLSIDYEARLRTYLLKLNYICHEAKQGYMEHLSCYQEVVDNSTLTRCENIWTDVKPLLHKVTSYNFYCQPDVPLTHQLKTKLETLRTCYQGIYREKCGQNASLVMGDFIRQAFTDPFYLRYKYKPDCELHKRTTSLSTTTSTVATKHAVSTVPSTYVAKADPRRNSSSHVNHQMASSWHIFLLVGLSYCIITR